MPDPKVLADCPALTQSSYRSAVAAIVNSLKAEFRESDQDMADRLGCSKATINNASNQRGNLDGVTLLRIGREYGLTRLGPVMHLIGGKSVPMQATCTTDDHLPIGAARGTLFLAKALSDQRIDDDEILEGASDIEAAYETFGILKWRLDGIRQRRAS